LPTPRTNEQIYEQKVANFLKIPHGHQRYKMPFFNSWRSTKSIFPIVHQILRIFESQIETKRIFSFINILKNLKVCHLQVINLKIIIFVIKNWPNNLKVGCKSPSNLV